VKDFFHVGRVALVLAVAFVIVFILGHGLAICARIHSVIPLDAPRRGFPRGNRKLVDLLAGGEQLKEYH
jgi:hypothetical protein